MKTIIIYYAILTVYILLWSCQIVAGHLTHSLIIVTDSYINLYRILDVSLGILHLRTQKEVARLRAKRRRALEEGAPQTNEAPQSRSVNLSRQTPAGRLFDCVCTYQFKRLPLIGSFINGLLLAAFLMSAAIEGLQTCFHTAHAQGNETESILKSNPLTYPLMLVAFALVGIVMQHCSTKAHEMREEELHSESLIDLSERRRDRHRRSHLDSLDGPLTQLSAVQLTDQQNQAGASTDTLDRRRAPRAILTVNRRSYDLDVVRGHPSRSSNSCLDGANLNRNASLEESSLNSGSAADIHCGIANHREAHISLRSLKFTSNLNTIVPPTISNLISDPEHRLQKPKDKSACDKWLIVRFLSSPLALSTCAASVYFVPDNLATEIIDAVLSLALVVLLFVASLRPMEKAGRVLLQAVPNGVDLAKLRATLKESSELIVEVRDLCVWSLTQRSNRVATCRLLLDKRRIVSEHQIGQIISEAKFKFLDQNIKCTTIEPVFSDNEATDEVPPAWIPEECGRQGRACAISMGSSCQVSVAS